MPSTPAQIATYATALIAALTAYGMLDQFSFDHPTLTVSGPSGSLDVDLTVYLARPVHETRLHIATRYARERMGLV